MDTEGDREPSKKDKIRPKKELFEYLSKEGIKDRTLKT